MADRTLLKALTLLICLSVLALPAPRALSEDVYTYQAETVLCVPDFESGAWRSETAALTVPVAGSLAHEALVELIARVRAGAAGNYSVLADLTLLHPGYLASCGTALVHLSGEIKQVEPLQQFMLCQAIANTVCATGEAKYCVILSDGRSLALDRDHRNAVGILTEDRSDDPVVSLSRLLIRRGSIEGMPTEYRADTAVFYPASAGHGVLAEVRPLSYSSGSPEVIVRTLLNAMSVQPTGLFDVPRVLPLAEHLTGDPVIEVTPDGENVLTVSFGDDFSAALSDRGILRSVMMAALTLTMAVNLPDISGVNCVIGGEPVQGVVPVGLFDGANEIISFERGYMMWQDFTHFMLSEAAFFYANDGEVLTRTLRSVPSAWQFAPLRLMEQLLTGPSYYDSVADLHRALPEGLAIEDLLSLGSEGDTVTLNVRAEVVDLFEGWPLRKKQNAVYSVVNTLTELPWCRRVNILFDGARLPASPGSLSFETAFMRY